MTLLQKTLLWGELRVMNPSVAFMDEAMGNPGCSHPFGGILVRQLVRGPSITG